MHSRKTILVISQVYPFPLHDGGRMDVFYRIKSLYELGHEVILIAFYNPVLLFPEESILNKYCKRVFPLPYLRRKLNKVFSLKPYSVASKENWKKLDEIFDSIQAEEINIDAIIAESFHTTTIAEKARKRFDVPRTYLRSHNHEPRFMKSVALSSNFFSIKRAFYLVESLKYSLYMSWIMKRWRKSFSIWHISPDELKEFEFQFPSIDQYFLPAGIDLSRLTRREFYPTKKVLFAGALFSPNNIHGINWYLKEVHPILLSQDKDYQLLVAGNTEGASPKDIQHIINQERVTFYDTPDEMDPIYSQAQVFINPMLLGAGVKLKTLDAALRGLPIVTTSIGNEGTGLKHGKEIFVGDSPLVFSGHVLELLSCKSKCQEITENAYLYLREKYDQKQELSKYLI